MGHIRHDIPDGYLRSRGVINLLPDWQRRLEELNPTLIEQARAMEEQPHWQDDDAFQRWKVIDRIVSGPLWSSERLGCLWGYMLGRSQDD